MDRNKPSSCEGQIKVRMASPGPRTLASSSTLGSSHNHLDKTGRLLKEAQRGTVPNLTSHSQMG